MKKKLNFIYLRKKLLLTLLLIVIGEWLQLIEFSSFWISLSNGMPRGFSFKTHNKHVRIASRLAIHRAKFVSVGS